MRESEMSYTLSQHWFDPIVKIDDYVRLIPINKTFKVVYIEPLDLPPKNFGAMLPSSLTYVSMIVDQRWEDLEMSDNELGHFRITPIDDVIVTISQPRAARRYTTKRNVAQFTVLNNLDPRLQMREIFVFEDRVPYITIINPRFYPQPTSRVKAFGYRYVLEPVAEARVATVIPVEAWVERR